MKSRRKVHEGVQASDRQSIDDWAEGGRGYMGAGSGIRAVCLDTRYTINAARIRTAKSVSAR
jgi:hypothetical protein